MEALAHRAHLKGIQFPRVITCPHEMVAMCMADGFARLTGKPQCVLVHVDVGTQMLGCAMHNASVARCPVLVFAGLSPFTLEGETRGSRTEYIHWLQDAPDQKQIVSQFCRFTGEFKTGKNIKQVLNRALQFATSDPKGPSYIVGAREIMEEEITPYHLDQDVWGSVSPTGLPTDALDTIVSMLADADSPLIIVGYTGRNHATVPELVKLVEAIPGTKVLDALGSDVCFPWSHRAFLGVGIGRHERIEKADAILVIDCDVPWIPTQCKPRADARIIHIDIDPLKQNMPLHYIPAFRRYRADSETAIRQLNSYIDHHKRYSAVKDTEPYVTRWEALEKSHRQHLETLSKIAATPADPSSQVGTSYLCAQLRKECPTDTIWCVEAVTNAPFIYEQLQVDEPGHLINCGGGGLGWSGGATIGVKLASDWLAGGQGKGKFVTLIVGDGTYMFGVPSTVYWIAQRYGLPTLTVVLSNKGWNAPRNSLTLVHPDGYGSKLSNEELNISFSPTPDFSGIGKAASGGSAWAGVVSTSDDLLRLLPEAIAKVQSGISAILEVRLKGACRDVLGTARNRIGKWVCGTLYEEGLRSSCGLPYSDMFPAWSRTKAFMRRDIFLAAADIMDKRREELGSYMHEEIGADQGYQDFILGLAIEGLKDTAGRIAGAIQGSVPESNYDGMKAIIYKKPYGVNVGIAPWNAPYHLGLRSISFALATGNTAILKGAELSPMCYWAIADVFREAGLPNGCLNLIFHSPTDAPVIIDELIANPHVKKVNFTGSTRVGSIIAELAGKHLKPVLMELGGKASAIVLEDANLEQAALHCARGAFMNAGQICMSTERILVHESVAERFQKVLRDTTRQVFGAASDTPVLITAASAKRNHGLVADAISKGAKSMKIFDAAHDGQVETHMQPVILKDVEKNMALYQTESFGPSVSLLTFKTEVEALELANNTEYGLSASVFTEDLKAAFRVADGLESGAVHINSMTVHDEYSLPHGGVKKSGFGRFNGYQGLDEFLYYKTVTWME
ncbi:hypothetical protein G7Z17_g4586 [Cylindrodendrum hubeiense]|uniref:Pyruvate decarboxylase n=1 Tax=Cylindrodendrum hubeiense TaxID=595255 RepID=A0A9P5LCI5_9HYPO|nr:hypothetical protein G7Z17_g4586 [Cylindrodendrum hubeiense]